MRCAPISILCGLCIAGCSEPPPSAPEPEPAPSAPQPEADKAPEPVLPAAEPAADTSTPRPPKDPNEACGRALVVAYAGAQYAGPDMKRTKDEALARAKDLRTKAAGAPGEFASLAKTQSDAPTSAERGGIVGTYTRDEWPDLHGALRDPLFALQVNALSPEPVDAPYGYVVLQRCAVEKVHGRHILVRYAGAKRAGDDITRDANEARARAEVLRGQLSEGRQFAELAKTHSDDSSAERGGDLGPLGRGKLALPMEEALFKLKPGEVGRVVETDFGFHVIQRMPD